MDADTKYTLILIGYGLLMAALLLAIPGWYWYRSGVQMRVWERQGIHMTHWEVFIGMDPAQKSIQIVEPTK